MPCKSSGATTEVRHFPSLQNVSPVEQRATQVKRGYYRNYLFPEGIAIRESYSELNKFETHCPAERDVSTAGFTFANLPLQRPCSCCW